jgi:hypothetical protein
VAGFGLDGWSSNLDKFVAKYSFRDSVQTSSRPIQLSIQWTLIQDIRLPKREATQLWSFTSTQPSGVKHRDIYHSTCYNIEKKRVILNLNLVEVNVCITTL